MGQVPPKSFLPSSPYGASPAANVLSPSQPAAQNAQTPLLPPSFTDPGTLQAQTVAKNITPALGGSGGGTQNMNRLFGRGLFGLLLLLLASPWAGATTVVTGKINDLGTGSVTSVFVRFWLRGCQGVQPRINGTALLAPTQGGVWYKDFIADANGNISGTVYSTRDASGNGNGEIECPSSVYNATWYGLQLFFAGKGGPETPVAAKNGVTLNVTNATPLSFTPPVSAPTGDTVYLRMDGGNSPAPGNIAFTGKVNTNNLAIAGPSPWIDVTASPYLATGNGVTDDTAAIQAAVTACPATGGTVFFPGTANSYAISSKITLNTNCNYVGVGMASKITYTLPTTANFPMLFCNGGSNIVITGLNFNNSNNASKLLDFLWTNNEATINGQEGFFCLGCTDVEIHDNVATGLAGAGFMFVRGARERVHDNISNSNSHYGIYLLANDNGAPTDDTIFANTVNNNGSFGATGIQGRGIVMTIVNVFKGGVSPEPGPINTKIFGNTACGNSYHGIESYRNARSTEIFSNTLCKNGTSGVHDYNNVFGNIHDNEIYGNGLPNVPDGVGGVLPTGGYGVRVGGSYFTKVQGNDVHDNNFGGTNTGQIHINGEGDFTGAYGNSVQHNHVRNNQASGTGQDIFVSAVSTFTFTNVQQFYKITAYDCTGAVLAQSAEVNNTPANGSVNLLTWQPWPLACGYIVFRGTATNAENKAYPALANAFVDENAAAPGSFTPPGSGSTLLGVTLTNMTTPADTFGILVAENDMIGSTTTTPISMSGFNTIGFNNPFTVSNSINVSLLGSLIPTTSSSLLGNSSFTWNASLNYASFFRSGGNAGFPDIFGNGAAKVIIGDAFGVGLGSSVADFSPGAANVTALGVALTPWKSFTIGTAATNAFTFTPPATAAARAITWTDPLGAANLPFTNNTSTTTTQVVHATATAGLYTTSAIASADINVALTTPGPIGGTTPNTGKFTSMTATTLLWSTTAPTIAGAGCGGSAASIVVANGTAAFKINVGTAPLTACTITMPAATTGWNCFATDITTNSTTQMIVKQTGAESTTSVTLTNFSDVAAASNFTANDILKVACFAD